MKGTVAIYIEEGLNFKTTAQRLNVHQNTVRYRVVRFEQLTRARLDHPISAFEVWWALQRAFIKAETAPDERCPRRADTPRAGQPGWTHGPTCPPRSG